MKSLLLLALKAGVTFLMIFLVYESIWAHPQFSNFDIRDKLQSLNWNWVLFSFACMLVSLWIGALQWKILLNQQEIEIPYQKVLRFYVIGLFFNNFMPGNVGGDVKKIYDIGKASGNVSGSITATFFDRIFGLFMLNGFSLGVGLLYFYDDKGMNYLLLPTFWLFIIFVIFFSALFSRRLGALIEKGFTIVRLPAFRDKFHELESRMYRFRERRLWLQIFVLSLLVQALRVGVHLGVAEAMALNIKISHLLFFIPLIAIVTALPISLGGFGPREFIAQTLFSKVGVTPVDSVLMQIWAYLITLICSLWGAWYFLTGTRSSEKKS